MRFLCSNPVVATIAALLLMPTAAGAGSPAEDLASLNAKRAAHGIPAGIVLDPEWSQACAQHVGYMRATNTVTHDQDPSRAAYTASGDWAGRQSVLASTEPWTASTFIWEYAPLHLAQLMAPQLERMGIADDDRLVCATTLPGYTRQPPAVPTVVTYPGNGASIYASEIASEWPMTPADALGVANPTGPNLLVYQWGQERTTDVGIRAVTLTGPEGRVRVRWIDRLHPVLGGYLPAGAGIVVPVAPLIRDQPYTAVVTFTNGVSHTWAFVTRDSPTATILHRTRLRATSDGRRRLCVERATNGTCRRAVLRYSTIVEFDGRVTGRQDGLPRDGVTVDVGRAAATRVVRTPDAAGRFTARFRVLTQTRQRVLRILALVPGDFAGAWSVRVR